MCSIMGYCGSVASLEAFKAGFDRTISRGPDDSRIIDTGMALLGFHRLSIMGLTPEGMQPFELTEAMRSATASFMDLKTQKKELIQKGYRFKSGSDCEILLPLYREYGTEMFAMLDAELPVSFMITTPADILPRGIPSDPASVLRLR